jgi:hypothetical protein
MKKIFNALFMVLLSFAVFAQEKEIDSKAVLVLDKMSDIIGDLESCSFKLSSIYDVYSPERDLFKKHTKSEVYMVGPDKMLINSTGDKGHRQFFYNGTELWYYSHDENNYGMIETPSNILGTIDSVFNAYQIEFPAADFFYPAFTDDLIETSQRISCLENSDVNGQQCYHILAVGKELSIQIWISNDGLYLPVKYLIIYNQYEGNPQFEAVFSNWQINPNLPDAMFNFSPPAGAFPVRFIAKNEKE